MKIKISTWMWCLAMVGVSHWLSGQSLPNAGTYLYQTKAYDQAIDHLLEAIDEQPSETNLYGQLADCFYYTNNYNEAEVWYRKLRKIDPNNQAIAANFGTTLMMNGRYKEAKSEFKKYKEVNKQEAQRLIQSCDFVLNADLTNKNATIQSLPYDSDRGDFSATKFENTIIFCTANSQNNGVEVKMVEGSNQAKTVTFEGTKTYNVGAISKTDQSVAFSHNVNTANYPLARRTGSEIFLGTWKDGVITNVKAFDQNKANTSTIDPCLADGGNTLYFASNRMGGFGGFDLYVSYLKNGKWSSPVNLGSDVNTPGNEISPALNGEFLYFASDYHKGFGGYDIFSAQNTSAGFLNVMNMGYGVNTPRNDYYPSVNGEIILLTSDRKNGLGREDLYMGVISTHEDTNALFGAVESENNIPEAIYVGDYTPKVKRNDDLAQLPNLSPTLVSNKEEVSIKQIESVKVGYDLANADGENPPPAFKIPAFKSNNMDGVDGARRVAVGEVITSKKSTLYFIQLASTQADVRSFEQFRPLTKFGNIYKVAIGNLHKIRLGYFIDNVEAQAILAKVRANGFPDAFMVTDALSISSMELVLSTYDGIITDTPAGSTATSKPKTGGNTPTTNAYAKAYKVRLASYEDPIWFDTNKVRGIGQLEQWSKGSWTIFILGGFNSYDEAEKGRIQAVNRGFEDAEVVIDNGGVIERIKKN